MTMKTSLILLVTAGLLAAVAASAGPQPYKTSGTATNKTTKATSSGVAKSNKPATKQGWKRVGTGGGGVATKSPSTGTKKSGAAALGLDEPKMSKDPFQDALAALKPADRKRCQDLLGELQQICVREASREKPDPALLQKVSDKIRVWMKRMEGTYDEKTVTRVKQQFDSIGFRN
jgi:hypothetical protein